MEDQRAQEGQLRKIRMRRRGLYYCACDAVFLLIQRHAHVATDVLVVRSACLEKLSSLRKQKVTPYSSQTRNHTVKKREKWETK
jgi:predicted SprT family Zn-dependent metalloprotease